ncbi:hypothetical protein ONZ45_g18230 [Pleurotus djamor]|nr:hypothetical protein ONZ45_g18230 [Pleurotus djamor]
MLCLRVMRSYFGGRFTQDFTLPYGREDRSECESLHIHDLDDFDGWLREVENVDDRLRRDRKDQRKTMLRLIQDSYQVAPPPSSHRTVYRAPAPKQHPGLQLPKITPAERVLLSAHTGCFKCRRFYAGHFKSICPNDFPDPATYKMLTSAMAETAKNSRSRGSSSSRPAFALSSRVAAVVSEDGPAAAESDGAPLDVTVYYSVRDVGPGFVSIYTSTRTYLNCTDSSLTQSHTLVLVSCS